MDVDVAAGRVTVQFDGEELSSEKIARRIEERGYRCPAIGPTVCVGG